MHACCICATVYSHRFYGIGDGENTLSKDTMDRLKMRAVYYKPAMPNELPVSLEFTRRSTLSVASIYSTYNIIKYSILII